MSQASIVASNRVFQLSSQLEREERLYDHHSRDEEEVTEKIRDRDDEGKEKRREDEEFDLDSLRGTGSAVGTTTIIEEEIETITTFEGPPDLLSLTRGDEGDSSSIVSHRSYISGGGESGVDHQHISYSHQELHVNNYDLNLSGSVLSVPFPELGVDVVDINYCSLLPTEKSSSNETRLTTDVKSWEDNWLFQKKRKKRIEEEEREIINNSSSTATQFALTDLHLVDGPVNMYIPNPSHSESFLEHFPLDDLEELSERDSVLSLAFSTDSEDEKLLVKSDEKLLSKPEENPNIEKQAEKMESSNFSSIDLLEEQISSLKIQAESRKNLKVEKGKDKSPSSGFLQFLKTHDSSDLSFNSTSPSTTLKVSPKSRNEQKKEVDEKRTRKNVSPISLSEQIPLDPPSFVPLNRRITECPRSDPCFVVKPLGASVQPNIVIQFCCRVKGSRPINVAWFKSDLLLKDDDTFRIFNSGNEFVMEVKGTRIDQSDTYSCCVYNSVGQQWTDFRLDVKEVDEARKTPSPLPSHKVRPTNVAKIGHQQQSPAPIAIITRTWAERTASLSGCGKEGVKKGKKESESSPRRENSMTSKSVEEASSAGGKKETSMGVEVSSIVSMKKGVPNTQEQSAITSDRPIVYSSSPPALRKRDDSSKRGITVNDNNLSGRPKLDDQKESKELCRGKIFIPSKDSIQIGKEKDMDSKVGSESGKMINSKSKDLSVYKRDYFVPTKSLSSYDAISMDGAGSMDRNRLDESMNGLEEKVYESSKFFTLRHLPSRQESTTQVSSLFSLPGSSSKEGESGCESAPSSQCKDSRSSHGDEEDGEDVEDSDENDAEKRGKEARQTISPSAIGPSVRKLVRRFSQKGSGLERRSTFTSSSNSIHDECRGSGIRVPLKQPVGHRFEVHSLTARNMKKEFLDERKQRYASKPLNRLGSMSMYDIDQVPKSLSPASGSSDMTATTDSPTNDGYISDDSTVSGTKIKFDSRKQHSTKVEVVSPIQIHASRKITSRTVTEKATFWQKRTDNRLLSDSSVNEGFPNVQYISYD